MIDPICLVNSQVSDSDEIVLILTHILAKLGNLIEAYVICSLSTGNHSCL
jgi:hypothetical protein